MKNNLFFPDPKKYTKESKRDKKYLEWIKTQDCCNPNCDRIPCDVVPAHMSICGDAGIATKAPDKHAIPLCFYCHEKPHKSGDISFWGQKTKVKTKIFVEKIINYYNKLYEGT